MSLTQLLFGFEGRIRRLTWWLAHLGVVGTTIVVWGVLMMSVGLSAAGAGLSADSFDRNLRGAAVGLGMVIIIAMVATVCVELWISVALAVKRCHDRNYPGAMALIMFIPGVGALWALIDLGFIDGTPGPNRFGPSPKAVDPLVPRSYAV